MRKIIGSVALAAIAVVVSVSPSFGYGSQGGGQTLVLNPGGGRDLDGTDGLAIVFNGVSGGAGFTSANTDVTNTYVSATGSDQVYFAGTSQWCCWSGVSPVLNIGGTLYGEMNSAAEDSESVDYYAGATSFDSITVTASSGAKELIANGSDAAISSSVTGDATATIVYSISHGGRTYTINRAITYHHPDNWYDETWTVTIPAGNTETVKFYLGGDAAPGSSDVGSGEKITVDGKIHLREKNPESGQYISYQERGSSTFDHYFIGYYLEPYAAMRAGDNLPDTVDDEVGVTHDAGIQIQWTLGSTAGEYAHTMRTRVGFINESDEVANEEDLAPTGAGEISGAVAILAIASMFAAATVRRRARA